MVRQTASEKQKHARWPRGRFAGACRRLALLTLVIVAAGLLLSGPAPVAAASAQASLVKDLGNLFSAAEETQLAQEAAALGAQYKMDIVIVTTLDTGGKTSRAYADDYFDYNGYGVGPDRDGILFLIDYDNREAYVSTSGSGIRYLTDQRIEQILDAVIDGGLKGGRNYDAARAFLTKTAGFLAAGIPSGQYNEPERPRSITFIEGLIGLLSAGGTGLGFFATTRYNYKGHPRPNVFEFRGNSLVSLGVQADNLVNTYVSTRHIPPPSSSSGGGSSGRSSTHTSSSGRTHGGGGRRF